MFLRAARRPGPGYDTDPRQNYELGEVVQESRVGQNVAKWQDMGKAIAAVLYSGAPPAQVGTACATDTTGAHTEFDPGNIISDQVFYNDSAFPDVAAVQAALDRIGAPLHRGDLPSAGHLHTRHLPPGLVQGLGRPTGPQSYASILFHLGKSCGINPQVAIVMVQKESQGLTRPTPPAALTGFGCPDTGPGGTANCDTGSAGVWAQTFGMFQAFARLHVDPTRVNYPEGKTSNILWNVAETGCGSAPVTVQNRATATLYTYTPYQPNAASLAAYPGEGDACSSYGNRNFFRLFHEYFGTTGGGKPTAVAVSANGPDVTIPNNAYVTPAAGRQDHQGPHPRRRQGPRRRVRRTGHALRVGRRRRRRRPEQRLHPRRRRLQLLRHRDRFRLLRPDRLRPGQRRRPPHPATPAANAPAAHPSPGSRASPATSSDSPATSPSTSAPSTASATSSKPPGSAHPSTSSRSPAPTTTSTCTATGPSVIRHRSDSDALVDGGVDQPVLSVHSAGRFCRGPSTTC